MRNFGFDNRSGDRRDSRRPEMHDAVCSDCGKNCQVPFRPSGDKPIYCSDCFEKKGGRGGRSNRGGFQSRNFGNRDGGGRPQQNNGGDRGMAQLSEKIGTLNNKLDTIIGLLSAAGDKKAEKKEKPKAKVRAKKEKPKKVARK